jgi:hypothetical protein
MTFRTEADNDRNDCARDHLERAQCRHDPPR